MTEKQAILRDLKVIAILDKKIDYSDRENIGAVLALNPKSLFSTEYGKRYLDRIRLMYDGKEHEHTCILCGAPTEGENPVCKNCYAMITLGNASVPEKPQPVVSERASDKREEPVIHEEEHAEETELQNGEQPEEPTLQEEQPDEEHLTDEELAEVPPEELIEKAEEEEAKETPEDKEEEKIYEETEQEIGKNYDPEPPSTAKGKRLDLARALILLFVVACFSIAVVCGLILIVRDLRIRHQNSRVHEEIVRDADLREHYSIIQTNTGYRVIIEDES